MSDIPEPIEISDLLEWLGCKITEAEKALRSREEMAVVYRTGTDEQWEAAAKLHPSTASAPRMTKADRLKSPQWQRKRLEIMERDNFTCRDCGAKDQTLHIHHCHYERGNPWETCNDLLLTLCWECHEMRQCCEDSIRWLTGLMFTRCTHEELLDFSKSVKAYVEENGDSPQPALVDFLKNEYATDIRWWLYAHEHPEHRKMYDDVMGVQTEWVAKE